MNSNRNITLSEALCEATHQAMKERDEVFIIGEGVTDPKFIFGKRWRPFSFRYGQASENFRFS